MSDVPRGSEPVPDEDVRRFAARHTWLVMRFDSEESEHPFDISSGMVLTLNGRWFLLTAAHVVEDALACERVLIGPPIAASYGDALEEKWGLRLTGAGSGVRVLDGETDAGVLELAPRTASEEDDLLRHALHLHECMPATTRRAAWNDSRVTVSGYPGELTAFFPGMKGHLQVFAYTSVIAGTPPVPEVPEGLAGEGRGALLPLWMSDDGTVATGYQAWEPVQRVQLSGASGGGYWVKLRDEEGQERIVLVATHSCSTKDPWVDEQGEPHYFAWGTPLQFHLAGLARANPELRDQILVQWPNVAKFLQSSPSG